jgi:hypothetical protein
MPGEAYMGEVREEEKGSCWQKHSRSAGWRKSTRLEEGRWVGPRRLATQVLPRLRRLAELIAVFLHQAWDQTD